MAAPGPEVAVEFGKAAMNIDPLLGSIAFGLLSSTIVLFWLLTKSYDARINDRNEMLKQYQDKLDKNTDALNKSTNVYEKNTEATVERNRATTALTEASNLMAQAFKSNESLIEAQMDRIIDRLPQKVS
jgi:3-hydroxyacyl-CoA dehydrogenase